LIVNADDFGYTRGVNRAIVEACRSGIVTSTSLLANGAAFDDAVETARTEPRLDIGCHLNFVEGTPVSPAEQIPHLVRRDGSFLKPWRLAARLLRGAVPESEIEQEAGAQIEKLLRTGIRVSHVDTHKHTHTYPAVARAVARAARRHDIRWIRRPFENFLPRSARKISAMRLAISSLNLLAPSFERQMAAMEMAMPDHFTGILLTGRLTRQAFAEILAALPPGVTEVMCHPGHCDAELLGSSTRLREERELERETVSDGAWRARARELGIELTSFGGNDPRHEERAVAPSAIPAGALRD
ncbi:MAG: ChbG/HpnK family deacetylase, partial [Terriglobia bacterium]